ncbi:MAG: hypothetical protein K6357_06335 [Elusimicrobiota bacterium]
MSEETKRNREFLIYFFIAFLISLPIIFLAIENPDLGWHLSAGRYIVENLSIPRSDFITWTKEKMPWVNSEWGTEVIYYLVYLAGKYKALYILRLINLFLVSITMAFILRLARVPFFNLIWFLPMFFLSILNILDLRPDNYSILFFAFLLHFLYKRRDDEYCDSRSFMIVVTLFVVWANIHPGYTYGLFLIAIHFVGTLLNENLGYIYGVDKKIKFTKSSKYALMFIIAFIATFINPYGYKIYSVFWEHFLNLEKYQNFIVEWQVLDIDRVNILFYYFFSFFTVSVYLYKFIRERIVDFVDVFLLLFFVVNSVMHIRLNAYGSIVASLIFLSMFSKSLYKTRYKIIFAILALVPVYMVALKMFPIELFNVINDRFYFASGTYSSVNFIKENKKYLKNLRMYNGWNIGGFLSWELYGYKKTFMDGRYIFTDMLSEHITANTYKEAWEKFSEKYNFDFAVLAISKDVKHTIFKTSVGKKEYKFYRPYFYENIDPKKWAVIYFDKRTLIIARRDRVPQNFLKDNEYVFLKPYDFDRLYIDTIIDKKFLKDIKKEIIRYQRKYNGNPETFSDVFIYIFHDIIDMEKGIFKYE